MKKHKMNVYLDSLRAGHAYLELLQPDEERGDVYGFYPAAFDEKKEVLFGKGRVRKDRDRLDSSESDDEVLQTGKCFSLTEQEYHAVEHYVQQQNGRPHWYFLIGYNCIDFLQDAYEAAKGKDIGSFLVRYSDEELEALSWVGTYARLEKFKKSLV